MAAHNDILHREFDRIAALTDISYHAMLTPDAPARAEANYAAWAALLLRYHDAIERVSGDEPDAPPVSMKGQPDVDGNTRPKPTRPDPSGSPSVEVGS